MIESSETTLDAVCTHCGCVCDDLEVRVTDSRIDQVSGACVLSEEWFLRQSAEPQGVYRIGAESVSFERAIAKAAELLKAKTLPVIYGLSRSSTPGQRAAVALADQIGAVIDTSASTCHSPSILAMQAVGESTCTLGEVKNRADLVLFWGSNPLESHPRHLERYSGAATGLFVPHGRADRMIVVIDTQRTETAEEADLFLQIEPGSDFDVLWALRGLVAGLPLHEESVGGVPREKLISLSQMLTSCQFGAAFFGLGLARGDQAHLNVEALLSLVTDLNAQTRFIARRMRNYGDVAGADSVLCWQTGYPFSVSLCRDWPRYNPGEFSVGPMLERGEPDACIIVGSDGLAKLSCGALAHLRKIPTILLIDPDSKVEFSPTVRITTGVYGIHDSGTAYRMDEVPIPLPKLFESSLPMDHEVLEKIASAVAVH